MLRRSTFLERGDLRWDTVAKLKVKSKKSKFKTKTKSLFSCRLLTAYCLSNIYSRTKLTNSQTN